MNTLSEFRSECKYGTGMSRLSIIILSSITIGGVLQPRGIKHFFKLTNPLVKSDV